MDNLVSLKVLLLILAVILVVLHLIEAKANSKLGWAMLILLVLLGGWLR